ncbi:MAG: hypothetical protein GF333_06480 [Candidatus Omnitrophica bacterium]|nr:hypothetical protein [Candidatus Omnitrophota bacterium]
MKKLLLFFICCCWVFTCAFSQTVLHLASGSTVEGELIEQTDEYVKLKFQGVTLTYWMEDIDKIELEDGSVVTPPAVQKAQAREVPLQEFNFPEDTSPAISEAAEEKLAPMSSTTAEPLEEEAVAGYAFREESSAERSYGVDNQYNSQGSPRAGSGGVGSREDAWQGAQGGQNTIQMDEQMIQSLSPGIMGFVAVALILGLAVYIYAAICLQTIAKKTETENAWLAWIPIGNVILMCDIAQKPKWWVIFFLLPALPIPVINVIAGLASMVLGVILWMQMAEARGKPSWMGILMIVPLVNFVIMGMIAFSD